MPTVLWQSFIHCLIHCNVQSAEHPVSRYRCFHPDIESYTFSLPYFSIYRNAFLFNVSLAPDVLVTLYPHQLPAELPICRSFVRLIPRYFEFGISLITPQLREQW